MAGKKRTNKKGGNAKKKKTGPSTQQNDATNSSSRAASNGGKPVCRFLLEGKCNRGDDCKFLHSPEACAAGARAQCLREGKSEDDAEMAASVAFQVAEKKREMKAKEEEGSAAASDKQTNDADSAHPKAEELKDQPPQPEKEVQAVNQTKKDESKKRTTQKWETETRRNQGRTLSSSIWTRVFHVRLHSRTARNRQKTMPPPRLDKSTPPVRTMVNLSNRRPQKEGLHGKTRIHRQILP
mmetsp:Transcript_19608/g.38761  ORF Transcript_19608/g.38761 Transcript_19608/m.38761 type:complete len:239 (-) Transcript_19608:2379-3095(-)